MGVARTSRRVMSPALLKTFGCSQMSECPTCSRSFSTEQGMKQHHTKTHGESLTTTDVECEWCGEEDTIQQWRMNCQERWFCCDECRLSWDSERKKGSFVGDQYDTPSGEDHHQAKREDRTCVICSEVFSVQPWKENQTCSRDCAYELRSQSISEAAGDRRFGGWEWRTVPQTGHEVRSSWEEEIDLLLYDVGVEYEYESQIFELKNSSYCPDFIVDDVVIEVKGYASDRCLRKGEQFMELYPDHRYVVVQGAGEPIQCDVHIDWDDREALRDVVGGQASW